MESSTYSRVTDWNDVIKKEVRGLNDADLGEVQEVNETIVVTEKGSINKEKFYLPKSITHGYNGRTLLFDITEEEAKGKFMTEPTTTAEAATSPSSTEEGAKLSTVDTENTEKSIPVIEERLEISKKESIEEAKVIKEPSKETRTVEVELVHEELIIERKAVQLDKASTTTTTTTPTTTSSSEEIMQSKTEINIPLMREDVVVSKKPYVKEEIVIKKKPVTETRTVTDQVTSEKVSVRNSAGEEVVEDEVKKK
ncbi:MAG: YsnF/AvaK domain-containing protein [Nitrososphaeraceae archaeon]